MKMTNVLTAEELNKLSDKERMRRGYMPKSTQLHVGDSIKVWWSNGMGYSIYTVEEQLRGPHVLKLHSNWEVCSDGKYKEVWS